MKVRDKKHMQSEKQAKKQTAPKFSPEAFLTSLGPGHTKIACRPRQSIFRQGGACDSIYFIESGKVRLSVVSEQGKEAVIAVLDQGNFVGESCLLGMPAHLASATALTSTTVYRIGKKHMIRVLDEQPALSRLFTAFLLERNQQIEEDLVDQLFNSSEKRLARILLRLARFGKEGAMEVVMPKISQELLAAQVGTTRPRINYFMNKFRKLGFIEYNGDIKVHPGLLNVVLHD
jgi:CRP/FNR family cyclic AMP-dependent transcriptional regulator